MVDPQASKAPTHPGRDSKKNKSSPGTGSSIREQGAPLKSLFLTRKLKQWQWVETVVRGGWGKSGYFGHTTLIQNFFQLRWAFRMYDRDTSGGQISSVNTQIAQAQI